MKRLNINFLSHLDPLTYSGGGEQITRKIIETGRRRGHRIRVLSMRPKKKAWWSKLRRFRKPDLWILFDVFNCPDHKSHFNRRFIRRIVDNERYVLGQNAYVDICYLNAIPCNGNIGDGTKCVEKKEDYFGRRGNRKGWQNGYCPVNDNRALFENALLNIFLSPLHASIFHRIYPATQSKTHILKPLIPHIERFRNFNQTRDIKYASYGGMSETKGFYNIRERFPDEKVVFFGSGGQLAEKFGYGEVIGRIPYDQMPAFLNRVENYIHLPRWPEAHGLIVNQAALCGCRLITNDHVGALSHDFDITDPDAYHGNENSIWEELERIAAG